MYIMIFDTRAQSLFTFVLFTIDLYVLYMHVHIYIVCDISVVDFV